MSETDPPKDRPQAALARLAAPVNRALNAAGALSALAELIWAAQSAVVALAIGGLVTPPAALSPLVAAALFALLAALRAGLDAWAAALAQRAATRLVADLRHRLIGPAARLDARATLAPAALATLAGEKSAALAPWAARYQPAMMRTRIVPLVLLLCTLPFSWLAAVILLIAGPLIPLFMALVGMAAQEASERQMAQIGTLNGELVERVAAAADLRLLGAEARAGRSLAVASETLRERTMRVLAVAFLSSTVLELFSALGVALVAVYVGFNLLGEIPFGSWGALLTPSAGIFILMIAPEFFQPLRDLAAAWHDRASALAVAGEIAEAEAMLSREGAILGTGAPAEALSPAPLSWAGLRLRPGPGAAPIAPPDGSVAPGEAVALAGPSGAGKTTLLTALAGLIRPEAGEIRWGETPLTVETADAIRAGIGWLPQAPRFIDAPLAEALTLGRPGDLPAALKAAQAEGIVAALPGGLTARLGDIGGGVSGGEARRLMIARAAHSGARLILADEPTADLDPETAAQVLAALLTLRARGAALLIASHDPAVIAAMDRVIPIGEEAR
ncbi:MAG: ABC transporter ATP-binding protein/permease [Paenirhodobacter sp.]|uniref:ABC transporter ATP-binding protein/permease n=1 Tax=Paenirhodobacter sp. TaxID=1965326 RepID=UPI003D10AEAF